MKHRALPAALAASLLAPAAALASGPAIQQHTLANGLTVLVVEDHALPLMTVEIAAKNGSMTEPPAYSGLSHLYEHMFFKANASYPSQEAWMDRSQALGVLWNGTTSTERVNYFFTTTSDHGSEVMQFMQNAIVGPLFDPAELERERVVVTGEMDRAEANPFYFLQHAVDQRVWWQYPTRKDPLGKRSTVLGATPAMMRTIKDRYYVPNNSVLVVTGDVKAAEVFAQAESLYKDWPRAADPFVEFPLITHPPVPYTSVVLVQQPVQAPFVTFTWHGPSTVGANVELTYAADLLSFVLQKPSSKYQQALVDSGACVSAAAPSWYTQSNTGPISIQAQAAPDKLDGCVKAILAELPKLREPGYLSDAELRDAAFQAEVAQALDRERPSQLAHTLTFWWTSAGLPYYQGYVANLRKVTRADITRYLDTYVLGKPFVFGAMVSPQMASEQHLDQAHFEALVGGKPWVAPDMKEASK
ncbi:MAG: pitrilysin family protein [Arenimonas sp.]